MFAERAGTKRACEAKQGNLIHNDLSWLRGECSPPPNESFDPSESVKKYRELEEDGDEDEEEKEEEERELGTTWDFGKARKE